MIISHGKRKKDQPKKYYVYLEDGMLCSLPPASEGEKSFRSWLSDIPPLTHPLELKDRISLGMAPENPSKEWTATFKRRVHLMADKGEGVPLLLHLA